MSNVKQHIESVRADASQKYNNFAGQDSLQTSNQSHALDLVKFRSILAVDSFKKGLVHTLNKFGIATNSNAYDNVLISNTLQGLKMKKNFGDELLSLMQNITGRKVGFADQSNGLIPSLNANDMISNVQNKGYFIPNNNFVSNCKNCGGNMKNCACCSAVHVLAPV